ncbi:MAG: C4-dicarboxylate ABC transporter permease, partial [Betaproteobacteria bacterium]|nr:C4-dicarboxylate ABC transporter permease [Betaproteobacteria bacterium]
KNWGADWPYVLWVVVTACTGVIALAGGLFGWLVGFASAWQRAVLIVGALMLIKPGLYTDIVGFGLLALVVGVQLVERRRMAESPART